MAEKVDFERAWLNEFAASLKETVGEETGAKVMEGSEGLSSDCPREEVISRTSEAMRRLASAVDERKQGAVITGCACQYPSEGLEDVRDAYEASAGDIGIAHRVLQAKSESFLKDTLGLEEETVRDVVRRGWGIAGVLYEDTIIAAKIRKSGNLPAYLTEMDPQRKRQLYCHCPGSGRCSSPRTRDGSSRW